MLDLVHALLLKRLLFYFDVLVQDELSEALGDALIANVFAANDLLVVLAIVELLNDVSLLLHERKILIACIATDHFGLQRSLELRELLQDLAEGLQSN